jgi:hypothetical protein
MSKHNDPTVHLVRALEEILTAAAQALAIWRQRLEERQSTAPAGTLDELLGFWSAFTELEGAAGASLLRMALSKERARWALKAEDDPAAGRMCELCTALLEVLGEEPRTPPATHRAPRRRETTARPERRHN